MINTTFELDKYLVALFVEVPSNENNFDILGWSKECGAPMLSIVSCMARDLVTVQISTVAFESAFNTRCQIIGYHATTWMLRQFRHLYVSGCVWFERK